MVFLRSSELRTLQWKDIDLDAATIVVPASRMKSGRPHIVPLARQAVRLLEDVQKMTGNGRYVFNGGRGVDQPLDYSIFFVILRALGYTNVITPHGFRVLASTWFNEQGWRADVIERQLSHLGADRTRRLYNRAEYMPERRKMMQAWADELDRWEFKARAASRIAAHHKPS
jgi:integrase